MAAATLQLSKKLMHHRYDLVLQAGIAGSCNDNFKTGDVVAVAKDSFGDIGSWEGQSFKSIADIGLSHEPTWYHADTHWISQCALPHVSGMTVATVTDNASFNEVLKRRWHPDIESMEGAALYYCCHQFHHPALQIRSVSNIAGDRNKANWDIETAIKNLNDFLAAFVGKLKHH